MTDREHPYTKEQIKELRRLNALSSKTRGSDRKDSPRRVAGDQFVAEIERIRKSFDPPLDWKELAPDLGIKPTTLAAKVRRRTGEGLPPSQKPYTGEPYNENRRTKTHFGCKPVPHPRTKANSYWNKALQIDVCATCQAQYNAKSRQKRLARKRDEQADQN